MDSENGQFVVKRKGGPINGSDHMVRDTDNLCSPQPSTKEIMGGRPVYSGQLCRESRLFHAQMTTRPMITADC